MNLVTNPIDQPARSFDPRVHSYGAVYTKTSALLSTLRHIVGEEDFDRAMRVYCERARFRHPTGHDLESTFIEKLGQQVKLARPAEAWPAEAWPAEAWPVEARPAEAPVYLELAHYFDQALRSTREIDFAVRSVSNLRRMGTASWSRDTAVNLVGGDLPENADKSVEELDDEQVTGVVVLHRPGGFELPVDVLVEFADGSEERSLWDGRESTTILSWPGKRVERASLDPEGKLLLEWRRANNSRFVRDVGDDGLSKRLGIAAEALSLAALGGLYL